MNARSRGRERRRPRRSRWRVALIVVAVVVPVLMVGAIGALAFAAVGAFTASVDAYTRPGLPLPLADLPIAAPGVAGYGTEQLTHACTILIAGRDLGFGERDRTIAVMAAMGESSLRNLDYGDWETSGVTNPDGSRTTSIGLFQQQDNWGTREQRLDPYTAATLFYRAMAARVPDRDALEPTTVAHRTQINADADHYARYWERAVRVTAALASSTPVDGAPACALG